MDPYTAITWLMWLWFGMQTPAAPPQAQTASVDIQKQPVVVPAAHPLTGCWQVAYHPNRAVRQYEIAADGQVQFSEFPDWKGRLTPLDGAEGHWLLSFDGDPESRVERLTAVADGRLLVEHYNPAQLLTTGEPPDQIGLGTLSASPEPNAPSVNTR